MKINILVGGIFRSGGMRIIFEYANRLSRKDHDVILYFPLLPYNFKKGETPFKSVLKNYYWRFKEILNYKKTLTTLYEREFPIKIAFSLTNLFVRDADVSIATQWPTAFSLSKLKKKKGAKIYFIQDYEAWNSNLKLVDESYMLDLNRITISRVLQKFLKQKFNSNSHLIYNGVDFNVFYNTNKIFNKPVQLLFLDHYLEKKCIPIAIETIKKVKIKYPELKVKCFGYKQYHDLPEWMDFIANPTDNEIRNLYSTSDILLFSSCEEGFGLPPAEAMACKCAVVSTAVGAVPEYAVHMKTAILTDPTKPEELFNGICYLIDNEDELKRISIAGFDNVTEFFDWNNSVSKFEEVLTESIKKSDIEN